MTTQEMHATSITEARDATEAVGMFLQVYCDFGTSRTTQIIDAIKLYVSALTERRQEVALEFETSHTGRNLDGYTEYSLHSPEPVVALLQAVMPVDGILIRKKATTLASRFDNKYLVLRASLGFASFGGMVIWQQTNLAGN